MNFDLVKTVETCYTYVQDNPLLLYYSHIPTALVSLLIGLFVFLRNKRLLIGRILFAIALTFSLWSFLDLIVWTSYDSGKVMFSWAILGILSDSFFILCLYFLYVFAEKKDAPLWTKIVFSALLFPVIYSASLKLNLSNFDVTNCESIETNFIINYNHFVQAFTAIWILVLFIIKYRSLEKSVRKQLALVTTGIFLFLLSFFTFDFISVKLEGIVKNNYEIGMYGLFGMVFFIAFLTYLIVRYKAFDIKLIATQAFVVALFILIGSQFFFIQNPTNIILNGITLAATLGFGYMLVKSVKLEVQRKEELQKLTDQLAVANDKLRALDKAKSEFISIASHQLRTPLTSIKGFGSLLLEGTYGEVPEAQRGALEKIYISNERLIQLVEDLLNISRIEAGRMEFDFQEAQIEDLVQEAAGTLELSAKAKGLYLEWQKPAVLMPKLKIDITKIKEVISNMIDNAIKYTQKGGITVKLERNTAWDSKHKEHKETVRMIVSDTGIGMDEEEINMIFEKFQRGKQVAHFHTDGTGLGMYIGKKIVAEHKGRIWAESDGKGKGSRFMLELPVN
jgi:signal transduction histidine kinase